MGDGLFRVDHAHTRMQGETNLKTESKETPNIKHQILQFASSSIMSNEYENFAFNKSTRHINAQFLTHFASFLGSKKYSEARDRGMQLLQFVLTQHGKLDALAPVLNAMNVTELYKKPIFAKHRLHLSHQMNVFLLGLYIYHNSAPLRKKINLEMRRTTPVIKVKRNARVIVFRYSGGNEYGEFLYRWRLGALCHDIGAGIQLCNGKQDEISDCLQEFPFAARIDSLDKMWKFDMRDLLQEVDAGCEEIDLSGYIKYQDSKPFPDSVHHDHGIFGALLFLRLMHEEYARHTTDLFSETRFGRIFWHPQILSNSILQIAKAIAMHNLEKYPQALHKHAKTIKIFSFYRHPFAWLLKIADVLQEWDKAGVQEATDDLPETDLRLTILDSKITVDNFPERLLKGTSEFLKNYTRPSGAVSLRH